MRDREAHLLEVLEKLERIRNECSWSILSECGLSDLTVRQAAYLRTIGEQGEVTFSRLAEITRNSKPTVTEMINRFVRMECVYREPCRDDRRVRFIRLTGKGERIAMAEHDTLRRMIGRMTESLDDEEQELLIRLLEKVR